MGGLGDLFGGLGELLGGVFETAEVAAVGVEAAEAFRGEPRSATETYDRLLTGGRRDLNVNDR